MPPVEEGDVDQTMDRGTADVVEEEVEEESGAAGGAKSDEASDWFSAWGAPLSTGLSGLSSLTQHVQSTVSDYLNNLIIICPHLPNKTGVLYLPCT